MREGEKMWFVFAIGSAVFAALTSILAKVGIEGVNSNLATAIRTVVVLLMAWGMVFVSGSQSGIFEISKKSWLFYLGWQRVRHGFATIERFRLERHQR